VPDRKSHFSKKIRLKSKNIFEKIFRAGKITHIAVDQPIFRIISPNHKFQAQLPCG
jgi:hypothetical protein